jgi:hypothetical protein
LALSPLTGGIAFAGLSGEIPPDHPVKDVVEVSAEERRGNQLTGDSEAAELQQAAGDNDGMGGLWGVKPYFASKTLWANVLGFAALMPVIGSYMAGENLDQWAEAISAAIAAVAFIASSAARIKAKYQLTSAAKLKA